jgi:hypothetical protein
MNNHYKNYVISVKNSNDTKVSQPPYSAVEGLIKFYHSQLRKLAILHKSVNDIHAFEGNISSVNGISDRYEEMLPKMKNIYYLSQEVKGDILEVGFNSGNSALIFLLANPRSKFYAYDMCSHSYVRPCVDYLNSIFNNRITLFPGNSVETLEDNPPPPGVSIFHVDGCHTLHVAESDIKNCLNHADDGAYIIFDDTDQCHLNNLYQKYLKEKLVTDLQLKYKCIRYSHCIGKINK